MAMSNTDPRSWLPINPGGQSALYSQNLYSFAPSLLARRNSWETEKLSPRTFGEKTTSDFSDRVGQSTLERPFSFGGARFRAAAPDPNEISSRSLIPFLPTHKGGSTAQ